MKGNYGDSTLFKYGDYEILVDGGTFDSSSIILDALKEHVQDGVLDMLILTHPHGDHYGGMPLSVFNNASITSIPIIIDSGADTYSSQTYVNNWVRGVRSYFLSRGSKYYPVKELVDGTYPSRFAVTEDLSLTFLDTGNYTEPGGDGSEGNPTSVAFSLRAKTYDFVMVGDIPSRVESDIMASNERSPFINDGDTVIYKAAHHGSNGSNSTPFINYLSPSYAWCSSGITDSSSSSSGPRSQHPFVGARNRIEAKTGKDNLYWNGTMGTIDFSLDAAFTNLTIHGEGRKASSYYDKAGQVVDPDLEKDLPLEKTVWASFGV